MRSTSDQGFEEVGKRHANLTPIRELKGGKYGKISFIVATQSSPTTFRYGTYTWNKNKSSQSGTLNGPVEVSVRGSKLALGQDIACNVFVEVEQSVAEGK